MKRLHNAVRRMKFKDIPDRVWFQDGSGRRMIKMQTTNGGVDFLYSSTVVPRDKHIPADVIVHDPIRDIIERENTGCYDVICDRFRHIGFNAVDDKGVICRCPLDVEFFVED